MRFDISEIHINENNNFIKFLYTLVLTVKYKIKTEEFYLNGLNGIDIGSVKLFLLLYADDMTIF